MTRVKFLYGIHRQDGVTWSLDRLVCFLHFCLVPVLQIFRARLGWQDSIWARVTYVLDCASVASLPQVSSVLECCIGER